MNQPSDRIVFLGLCALLLFLPLPIGSVEEWSVFVFEAGTIALFLVHAGGRLARRGTEAREEPWDGGLERLEPGSRLPPAVKWLLGIFMAMSVLQVVPLHPNLVSVLSPRAYGIYAALVRDGVLAPASRLTLSLVPGATLYELALIVCYGLFGFLVWRTVRTRRRAEALVVVILAAALFQAFYGMAETFSGHEAIFGRPKRYGAGSVTGTFVNRNHFAGFMEMAFPLGLGYLLVKARYFAMEKGLSLRRRILWFSQESLQWTLLLGLVPVFIGVGLVFSKSRSGIMVLAVTAVLAGAAAASWRQLSAGDAPHRAGRVLRAVVIVILAAAVWIGVGPVVSRFAEIDVSAESRTTFYRNTLELIYDYGWTGTGKGTYVNAYAMVEKVDDRLRLSFAHNDYLETLAENGIVGGGALILAGLGLVVWLAAMWRRRRDPFAKGIGLGAALGVAALLVHGFTDFNLQITANAAYFAAIAMLGAAVLARGVRREETNDGECPASEAAAAAAAAPAAPCPPHRHLFRWIVAVLLALLTLAPALRDFLGFRELAGYRRERSRARSVESAYPALAARLARARTVSPRAVFRVEAARLEMEMARVANEAGREEERDTFCDKAVAAYGQAIAANPIDAAVLYETGTAYLLYNFPLMTYQDRAKAYFRAALAAKPADETINLNVLFLYFAWWPELEEHDRRYAAATYRAMLGRDAGFAGRLEERWSRSYGSPDALRAILAGLTPR